VSPVIHCTCCAMAPLSAWRIAPSGFFPRRTDAGTTVEWD
jgi:hypothetical protein